MRFAYESHDDSLNWFRSYGNENWEYDEAGLNRLRYACINDLPIKANERKFLWDRSGPRPADHPGLSDLVVLDGWADQSPFVPLPVFPSPQHRLGSDVRLGAADRLRSTTGRPSVSIETEAA